MKFLFTLIGNSRRSNYLTGDTLRNGNGGGSGTDTSTILIAEYLASQGHEVVVVSEHPEPQLKEKHDRENNPFQWGQKSRGVIYSDFNFTNVDIKEFDVLVNSLWFQDYEKLPVKITKALIYWCHMQWLYGITEITNFAKKNNLKLGVVHISEWEKSHNMGTVDVMKQIIPSTISTIIPNPLIDDIINQVLSENIVRKPHKFIFHASWPRGGNVAIDAVRNIPWSDKEFHAFDYLMVIHDHKDSFFHLHNGVDKITLFRQLAESQYFIYPLYTPYQDVHKDTFSCVVAEALALGTTVVTYPLGALPENFNGFVHWLDFPPDTNPEEMQKESLSKDLQGKFKITSNIVNKVLELDSNPSLRDANAIAARDQMMSKFNVNAVGQQWDAFINKLLYENK